MIRRGLSVAVIAWALGFVLWTLLLPGPLAGNTTDAIVVPTGGPGRIDRGVALLRQHQAKRMLITGVGAGVREEDLARAYRVEPALFACCVDLGRDAVDTRSNAGETAGWLKAQRLGSVRLVTSDWHLPRARMELRAAVGPHVVVLGDGVPSTPRLTTLVNEYDKWLLRRVALWVGWGRMSWLRTLLFLLAFYGGSVLIILALPITGLFGRRPMIVHARYWSRYQRWCARLLLGITVRVEGTRPTHPVLYAVKHQSFFEAIDMADALDGPAIILKRELTRVPLWGWATGVYGAIAVDREASAAMLRRMLKEGAALTAEGRSILLFPEGTRVPPGEQPPLKSGFAGLYKTLKLPVVPIAVDSGRIWPKRGPKRPGVITYRFGEEVPPGLPRDEAERRVWEAINALEASPT